jgi:hypothetical protein
MEAYFGPRNTLDEHPWPLLLCPQTLVDQNPSRIDETVRIIVENDDE